MKYHFGRLFDTGLYLFIVLLFNCDLRFVEIGQCYSEKSVKSLPYVTTSSLLTAKKECYGVQCNGWRVEVWEAAMSGFAYFYFSDPL